MRMSSLFSWVLPGARARMKNLMPRTLYGRAALILVVPIVTIQLVVSIVFIQRHFEDVTRQMTGNVVREMVWMLDQIDAAPSSEDAQAIVEAYQTPFALTAWWGKDAVEQGDIETRSLFYDLAGKVVIEVMLDGLPRVDAIDLASDKHFVMFRASTKHGALLVLFSRLRVSAPNPHQLLVLMIVTSLVMTGVAYVFMRNQMRPIKKLARVSEAFGKGQWEEYAPSGAAEVRAAGGAFLAMRARIERQIEQRTMMLSGVSHDLRTPLTRLKLSLSLMDEDDDEIQAMHDDIIDMERLIDSFLDFARGDAHDQVTKVNPIQLARLCVTKATRNGGRLRFINPANVQGDVPDIQVKMREQAITRALDNFISNGLRYGKDVQVSVFVHDRSFVFRVEDNGPGIAPEDRSDAVKPFVRLGAARNQNKDSAGTGLGLAIAFDIARTHGGSLRLGQSRDLGGLMVELVIAR